MSLIFSRQCEYALQAILVLVTKKTDGWTALLEISERLNVPVPYLAKILQDLTRKGILNSHKGPQGGFKLARPVKQITLYDIVDVIDGTELFKQCVLGFPDCSSENPCPMHDTWTALFDQFEMTLRKSSVTDLANNTHKFVPLEH